MGKRERKEKSVCRAESIDKKEKSQKTNSKKKISDIAYQNKDIASKVFAEQLKGKSFNVYGVETGKIRDKEQQLFVLAGILTFTDKIIDEESAKAIRRAIRMTKVAMIFEKEKEEAIQKEREKAQQAVKEEKQKGRQAVRKERQKSQQAIMEEKKKGQQAIMEEKKKIALKMIADGELSLPKIARYADMDIRTVTRLAGQQID